ncbi:DUF3667 domain-containing protein [Pedobacter sp. HMF7647]|uniref:DUF3667 domain-containing protein n=1 Tax=Hufsiella arboris TaxID=2695275 RepID=A0A7K1Y7I3_9SPHI|nr:DUF3667 domain-containing protein [Hufsiella arboris]MXV50527.1 DUF3667 domain-containing protein [Hufsiella arboris]
MSNKHHRTEKNCLNCGFIVEKNYCSNCGQENVNLHESFWHLLYHSIGHYFHFDSKFGNSVVPLLTKPGYLTNEYNAGRRASHFPPISLYLFISFIFFILVLPGKKHKSEEKTENRSGQVHDLDIARKKIESDTTLSVSSKRKALSALKFGDRDNFNTKLTNGIDTTVEQYEKKQASLPVTKRDGYWKSAVKRKIIDIQNDGSTYSELILHNIPKMMFVLLPLFALILMFFFRNSGKFYVEHLIHAVYVHSFLFALIAISVILQKILPSGFSDWIQLISMIAMAWYVYKSIRVVYKNSRRRTIVKMFALLMAYGVLMVVSFLILTLTVVAVA